ncbi:MAG: DUF418 domain-containing protein [Oligoflexia bacterium]|nr:DUF418 domain-containing protein [Oligoflexia bacterium]
MNENVVKQVTTKRIEIIDALRGLAMLGIMIVNFPSINCFSGDETSKFGGVVTTWDKFFEQLNFLVFNGKFYPIFAFLFGFGSYIFYTNAKNKGFNPLVLISRRYLILLFLGCLHIFFVWWGDILLMYAILGFLLIPFMELSAQKLLKASLFTLLLIPVLGVILGALASLGVVDMSTSLLSGLNAYPFTPEQMIATYSAGSFSEIVRQRLLDYLYDFTFLLSDQITIKVAIGFFAYYLGIFGLFLLGVFVAKSDWHKKIDLYQSTLKKSWWGFLIAAVAIHLILLHPFFEKHYGILKGEILAAFYVITFIIVLRRYEGNRLFDLFRSVGKMSLSAYLAHTIFVTLLLYGYGLGLFFKIGPAHLFPLSVIYYFIVGACCKFWLRFHEFGPVEYLWRRLTYLK